MCWNCALAIKELSKNQLSKVLGYAAPQYDDSDDFARYLMANGHPRIISEGYIVLQAEGHSVEFRNIELMKISKE